MERTFTILEHFSKDDKECLGDYYDIEILDDNEKVVVCYGDAYHDDGHSKAEGFIDGIRFATGDDIKIKYDEIADRGL